MADDQETVTAAPVAAGGALVPRAGARPPGPAAIAAELLARTRAGLPVLAGLGEREELLAAAWLASLRAARTRRAYAADLRGWLGWLAERGTDVLHAGRVHVDLWAAGQQDRGAESSTVRRRLSALSSFYRYCAAHDPADRIPTAGVARPMVDPDDTATIGLDRDQARALVAAADADTGPRALRAAAVIRLLLHNALRVDEACAANVTDLGADAGHRVLRVTRKGARKARIPLAPATVAEPDPLHDFRDFRIVDGQQRLTTLSVAIAALRDVAAEDEPSQFDRLNAKYLVGGLNPARALCDDAGMSYLGAGLIMFAVLTGSTAAPASPPAPAAPVNGSASPVLTQRSSQTWTMTIYLNSAAFCPAAPTFALTTTQPAEDVPSKPTTYLIPGDKHTSKPREVCAASKAGKALVEVNLSFYSS